MAEPRPRQIMLRDNFLARILPQWQNPRYSDANAWRYVVRNQPIALNCRDTIIMNILSLQGHVVAREPENTDKYEAEIDYYENLIANIDDEGYESHNELILQDALDTPFGGCSEIGHENDDPKGKVVWVKHMDSATLYPTGIPDFPVAQRVPEMPDALPVLFPRYAVSRITISPRPEIKRKGWGMAPPEKIFFALELLGRGDKYYADLLLDTPEAGILDLGNISEETATDWLNSWRDLLAGPNALKIPVLYEHDTDAKWIPFTQSPSAILFDKVIVKYDSIVAAGYGLSLGDVGDSTIATNSLAASIRQERKTKRTGIGYIIAKVRAYWNRILPEYLKWEFFDLDEETMVAKGRARLANSLALTNMVEKLGLDNESAVQQLIADGMLTVPVTSLRDVAGPIQSGVGGDGTLPPGQPKQQIRELVRKKQVAPSQGGEGQITTRSFVQDVEQLSNSIHYRRLVNLARQGLQDVVTRARANFSDDEFNMWANEYVQYLQGRSDAFGEVDPEHRNRDRFLNVLRGELQNNDWWKVRVDDAALTELSQAYSDALYEGGGRRPDAPILFDSLATSDQFNESLLQAISVSAAVDALNGSHEPTLNTLSIVDAVTDSVIASLLRKEDVHV